MRGSKGDGPRAWAEKMDVAIDADDAVGHGAEQDCCGG